MILAANNLTKSFSKSKSQKIEVIKNTSLEIEAGKITMIEGVSGAGKSTLLHILCGLDKPDSGSVKIKGIDIFKMSEDRLSKFRNKHIGFIFQFHHLLPEFTAAENVAIAKMIGGARKSSALEEAKTLLRELGLGMRSDHKPAELSGGEQQRVAIARALINKPDLILADEPTGNLDSKNSHAVFDQLLELRDRFNQSILLATHNKDLVKLADRLLEMKDGKLFDIN